MNIEKRTIAWKGLTLRSADDSGTSTVEGVAVPFGDIIDTWDGAETFDRDCSFEGLDEAKLCFEHGETIGRITKRKHGRRTAHHRADQRARPRGPRRHDPDT